MLGISMIGRTSEEDAGRWNKKQGEVERSKGGQERAHKVVKIWPMVATPVNESWKREIHILT